MTKREKLLKKAQNSPNNLHFADFCHLAELYGFVADRQESSHIVYKHHLLTYRLPFQDRHGKAKAYQVRQLLEAIEELEELGYQGED